MTDELFLLRHAKSDWDSTSADFDRPLNKRGLADAPRIGQWLHDHKVEFDCVLSSPARRAAQTAQALCVKLGISAEHIHWDKRLYLASLETLLDVLAEQREHRRLILIGHNPGIEQLLEYLAQEPPPRQTNGKLVTTATLAQLQLTNAAACLMPNSARLLQLIRPRDLVQNDAST